MNFDVYVIVLGGRACWRSGTRRGPGVDWTVFRRRAGRSKLTRAFAVRARALGQLDARGIADKLVATGTPGSRAPVPRQRGARPVSATGRFSYLLVTLEYETERVLWERRNRWGGHPLRHRGPLARCCGTKELADGWQLECVLSKFVSQSRAGLRLIRAGQNHY